MTSINTRENNRDEEAWQAVGESVAEVVRRSQPMRELFVVSDTKGIALRGELTEALAEAVSALVHSGVIYMGETLGLTPNPDCEPHEAADWIDINTVFYPKKDSFPDLQSVRIWSCKARPAQLRSVE